MIKHILKIIWIDRTANAWILLELILVFCILWFCADYLFFTAKRYMEPKGYDIEHVYKIGINMKDEGRKTVNSGTEEEKDAMRADIWTIFDRIKKYPAIEAISYSNSAVPYSGSWSNNQFFIDSVELISQTKTISPDFFKVFKIDIVSGAPFTDENIVSERPPAIISGDRNDMFGPRKVTGVDYIRYSDNSGHKVIGTANKSKPDEFSDYGVITYYPMKRDWRWIVEWRELSIRVKPEADKNFIEQFTKDMRDQLEVGHYFLASVIPIEKTREVYMDWQGYSGNLKSIYSVSVFLIINIFLGIIGTFWFRTQSRREEIGLRIAMGATKTGIKKMFISETLLLLILASAIASVICINITMVDVLKDIGLPVIERNEESISIAQYFINYGITFVFLALIATIAVWYPSRKASDIEPAEALRND